MLIIVKELYCYLLKKQKINERYEQEENDKVFFTKIFGIPFFDGLDITEANEIYNHNNWNTINFFTNKRYKIENQSRLIHFMKINNGWGSCVERFDLSEQYKYEQYSIYILFFINNSILYKILKFPFNAMNLSTANPKQIPIVVKREIKKLYKHPVNQLT